MKRLFTFLIISILFSQTAWAFHDIEINQQQDRAYIQLSDQNDQNDQNDISDDYDHCGHASAHLVGLLFTNVIDIYVTPESNVISEINNTSSINYQPPVPPPTV